MDWLAEMFKDVWVPSAVDRELKEGRREGYEVPTLSTYGWLSIVDPRSMPSEWLALDLGAGELAAMALALENPSRVILLDDALARRTAQAAGLVVWGTLKIVLEAKSRWITHSVGPWVDKLADAGMWLSGEIRQRILSLAGERDEPPP